MDHASEIGNAPDVNQDAALLCSVSDQMHLDAHQDASVFAPHPSCGRFRSTAATARCRMIGESSTNDSERDSCKVQSSFFTNERLSHEEQRSPSYVLQVGVSIRMTGSVSAHPVKLPHALQSSLCAVTSHDHSCNRSLLPKFPPIQTQLLCRDSCWASLSSQKRPITVQTALAAQAAS